MNVKGAKPLLGSGTLKIIPSVTVTQYLELYRHKTSPISGSWHQRSLCMTCICLLSRWLFHQSGLYLSGLSQKLPHIQCCVGQGPKTGSRRGKRALGGVGGVNIYTMADFCCSHLDVTHAQLGRKVQDQLSQGGVNHVSQFQHAIVTPSQKWAPHFSQ